VPAAFLPRDEFVRDFPHQQSEPLPAAFAAAETGRMQPFGSRTERDAADLNALVTLVQKRLADAAAA